MGFLLGIIMKPVNIYFAFIFLCIGLLLGHTLTEDQLTVFLATLTGVMVVIFLSDGFTKK